LVDCVGAAKMSIVLVTVVLGNETSDYRLVSPQTSYGVEIIWGGFI
jgi:hypothetical protein